MKSDIQIAQEAQMLPAADIAAALGVEGDSPVSYTHLVSMTSSASAPMRYSEDGLAKCCRSTRSAASAAASDTRVVAALSR